MIGKYGSPPCSGVARHEVRQIDAEPFGQTRRTLAGYRSDKNGPRLNLAAADLKGLLPMTVINAQLGTPSTHRFDNPWTAVCSITPDRLQIRDHRQKLLRGLQYQVVSAGQRFNGPRWIFKKSLVF